MFMRCPSPLPPFPPHSNIEAVGGALRNIPARDKLGHHLGASRGHKHPILDLGGGGGGERNKIWGAGIRFGGKEGD